MIDTMTREERATTLAALRGYQSLLSKGSAPRQLRDIANDGGLLKALTAEGIDHLCDLLNTPSRLPTFVVTIEGGMVSSVVSDTPAKVAVVNYDVDRSESESVVKIPQGNGKFADGGCYKMSAEVQPDRAYELLRVANMAEQSQESIQNR